MSESSGSAQWSGRRAGSVGSNTVTVVTRKMARTRPQVQQMYDPTVADLKVMRVCSRSASCVPSAAPSPRNANQQQHQLLRISSAAVKGVAAEMFQAEAAMERRRASRRQSRQASRMSRLLSPREKFSARGSDEATRINLARASEALRRFEEAASTRPAISAPIPRPDLSEKPFKSARESLVKEEFISKTNTTWRDPGERLAVPEHSSRSTEHYTDAPDAQNLKENSTAGSLQCVDGHTRETLPGKQQPGTTEKSSVEDAAMGTSLIAVTEKLKSGKGTSDGSNLRASHADKVQHEMLEIAKLEEARRASRIASRLVSRAISRNPAALSSSVVRAREDVAKAAAEELSRRLAAEKLATAGSTSAASCSQRSSWANAKKDSSSSIPEEIHPSSIRQRQLLGTRSLITPQISPLDREATRIQAAWRGYRVRLWWLSARLTAKFTEHVNRNCNVARNLWGTSAACVDEGVADLMRYGVYI